MVRGHHAGLAVARHFRTIDEIHHRIIASEVQNKALPSALGFILRQTAGAADNRRDVCHPCRASRQFCAGEGRLALPRQPLFGQCHQRDHALVGFPGAGAKAENTVLDEDQAFDGWIGIEYRRRSLGQSKTRHQVWHVADARAKNLAAQRFAVGLIGERKHCGGMGVVDEFVRDERVQQRLDGRVGSSGIDQIGALQPHHFLIGKFFAPAKF